jgi:putative FmdB family regulatory protein
MPIYDYRCHGCRRRISLLFQTYAAADNATCPHCGSRDLSRLITRFAVMKSEERRLDDLGDGGDFGDLDENDPRSVARWARRMGDEFGEDLGPESRDMIDQMEAGEMPDDDMAGAEAGGDFDGDLGAALD